MDADALQELQQRAVETALKSGRIEDIEKATNITKQAVEVRKAILDSTNQPDLLRYEEFKTWAALIVPFLSIATLAVTIYIQAGQLKATREASEATEWRETVKNVLSQLSRPSSAVQDPALALMLLAPYTSNGRFVREATLLSVGLLSRAPSSDRFKDYFVAHHLGENKSDIPFLTNLNRELNSNFNEVEAQLRQPSHPEILTPVRNALLDEIEFTTGKLCVLYRGTRTSSAASADFRDVFLKNGDLSGSDLNGADLIGARLESIKFADASLTGNVKFDDSTGFVNSQWWDAREIAKPLLVFLSATYYPFFASDITYDSPPPDKQQYINRVQQLCRKAGIVCESGTLKYGIPQPTSTVGESSSALIKDANLNR